MVAPMRRRFLLTPYLHKAYCVSQRRACQTLRLRRATVRYRSIGTDDPVLRASIKEIATSHVRYGFRRIHVLLRRESCG